MFNTTIHKHESKVVAVTKEIEKTITPDKVTEMYDKVREQVEHDILAAIRVESNSLNGVVVHLNDSYSDMTSHVLTRFTLNGKPHQAKITLPIKSQLTSQELYRHLEDHYTSVVKNEVFREVAPVFTPAISLSNPKDNGTQ